MSWLIIVLVAAILFSVFHLLKWKVVAHAYIAYLEFEHLPQPSDECRQKLVKWVIEQMIKDLLGKGG